MMGKPNQLEPKLFYHGISLDSRMPKGHPLRKIEQLVEFNFVRSKVHDLYGTRGNESVDPAVILKLMFLLFYENIKSERASAISVIAAIATLLLATTNSFMTTSVTATSVLQENCLNDSSLTIIKTA